MVEPLRSGPRWRLDRLLGLAAVEDPDVGRVARFVAIIAASGLLAALLAAGLALAEPSDNDDTLLAVASIAACCLAVLWLVRKGSYIAAGRLGFLAGIVGTTALVVTGRSTGFEDVAMMLYPVMVVAASLLLDRLEATVGLTLVLILLAGVLASTLVGYLPSSRPTYELVADFGFAVLIVVVSGVASRLMAESIERSSSETRASQKALARANEELERQAEQREKLIEELEARNTELQRFTYTVSHDLKSPLVTIGGFVGCLERGLLSGDRDQLLADLEQIKQARERMSELLEDLLKLSRAGRLKSPTEEVPFEEIIDEARRRTLGVLENHGVRLIVGEGLPVVRGDRLRLVQVVQNLLENAAKFSQHSTDPLVEIGVRRQGGETAFYVRDDGIGIAPEHHQKIFTLFHKLDPGTPGTGVGLALVKRIVEAHGGRVWVESEGSGRGSTFYFTLP